MSDPNISIDPALLAEFIDESEEMLAGLDSLFVALEANPKDSEAVSAIFRPIHSIKGNSGFFGFAQVKKLSHEMETLLDLVRKNTLAVSQDVTDVLLEGVDELKAMFERVRNGRAEVVDPPHLDALVEKITATAAGDHQCTESLWQDVFQSLEDLKSQLEPVGEELRTRVDTLIADLRRLAPFEPSCGEKGSAPSEEAMSRLKGPAEEIGMLLADPIEDVLPDEKSRHVLQALEALRECAVDPEAEELAGELLETYRVFVGAVGLDGLCQELLLEKLREVGTRGTWSFLESAQPQAAPGPEPSEGFTSGETETRPGSAKSQLDHGDARPKAEAQKTMRVAEAQIDTFLAYVGELLVIGDMFGNLQKRMAASQTERELLADFKRANETFSTLSNSLQKSIMSVRKVPIRPLLQKVPRIVRDIATASGKEIAVELQGEDVTVDKSLVDLLDAPLTHMVRNAADHGIDPPGQRQAAGKDPRGTIRVRVEEAGGFISLAVEDDGAGLDYDAIRAKAESLGQIQPGQHLEEDDVVNLIFSSGVSTAKTVTEVSGRGVGMDVVRRMLDEAGGSIKVASQPGKGSAFEILLPNKVTTQIILGYLIRVAGQPFVIPMDKVRETSAVEPKDIKTVAGKGRCIVRNGQVCTVTALRSALGVTAASGAENGDGIMVTVASGTRRFALTVDEVLGVQQVVLRQIEGIGASPAIAAGALLGDGSVALVLDVDRLGETAKG